MYVATRTTKCPKCKAQPGKACKGPGSSRGPHVERVLLARDEAVADLARLIEGPQLHHNMD
jgi:hypothetical protein